MAPTQLLANEILFHIFEDMAALEAYESEETGRSTTFDVHRCPWVLTYVSRRWRSIVVAAPSMWTNIHVTIKKFGDEPSFPPYGALQLLQLRLGRSQSYPLHVKLHFGTASMRWATLNSQNGWDPSTLFQILLDHGNHIEFFDVDVTGWTEHSLFNDVRAVRFPQLHALRFHDEGSRPIPGWLLGALTTASQLHELDIHPRQFRRMVVLPQLTTLYSNLTVLFLGSKRDTAHPSVALYALAAMPNLEQCTLHLDEHLEVDMDSGQMEDEITPLPPPMSIVIKELFELEVHGGSFFDMNDFFLPLTLPSLGILELDTRSNVPPIAWLIERSKCCISSLQIRVNEESIEPLRSMLQNMPELICLTIQLVEGSTDGDPTFFEALIAKEVHGNPIPCPNLERLYYEMNELSKLQVQALIRLERSRSVEATNGVAFLQYLSIQVNFSGCLYRKARLRMFEKEVKKMENDLDELRNICETDPKTDLELDIDDEKCQVYASYCFDSKSWIGLEDLLDPKFDTYM